MHLPFKSFEAKIVHIMFLPEIRIFGRKYFHTYVHCSRITVAHVNVNILSTKNSPSVPLVCERNQTRK